MRLGLLTTSSWAALTVSASLAFGSDALAESVPAGKSDRAAAATTISVEFGHVSNDSAANMSFPTDGDKLGNLDALPPGDDAWQFRVDLNQTIDPVWDRSAGLGLIALGDMHTSAFSAEAMQNLAIGLADLGAGYRPETSSAFDIRFFGGVRGLYASNEASWIVRSEERNADFDDDTWAIGPRVGVDISLPIEPAHGIGLVGSLSAAALIGYRQSDYSYLDGEEPDHTISTSNSSFQTIWNLEAMAGVNFSISESANLTIGYRAQSFQNLVARRSNIDSDGTYSDDGDGDVIVHGPFLKMTVAFPPD